MTHDFPHKVIDTLNEGTRHLDAATLAQLYAGRRQALAAVHTQHAGQGVLALRAHPRLWLGGLALLVLAGIWFSMQRPPQPAPELDTGALDIQLLTGEVPPQVFVDWSLVRQEQVEDICFPGS